MMSQEARELGRLIAACVHTGRLDDAYALLSPVLAERTPFRLLRAIGQPVGAGTIPLTNAFLERIAEDKTEGGWVVIASALCQQLDRAPKDALERCRTYIVGADVWYAADILGEGVAGEALVKDFALALTLLAPWRTDASHWVRRAVGTSAHYWAKRSRGAVEYADQAKTLLSFLEPMFEEWDMVAVKGIGWGLKTLGKHYPDLLADWLEQQVVPSAR